MFVSPDSVDDDDAAFFLLDDPTDPSIPSTVAAGFLVRTFIDPDSGPELAEATGAHSLSSDTPEMYRLPDADPVRCNPVHVTAGCSPAALESPAYMAFGD